MPRAVLFLGKGQWALALALLGPSFATYLKKFVSTFITNEISSIDPVIIQARLVVSSNLPPSSNHVL